MFLVKIETFLFILSGTDMIFRKVETCTVGGTQEILGGAYPGLKHANESYVIKIVLIDSGS